MIYLAALGILKGDGEAIAFPEIKKGDPLLSQLAFRSLRT